MSNLARIAAPQLKMAVPVDRFAAEPPSAEVQKALETREAFSNFFGETFFGQMLKSMRSLTDKAAYFHGGRGEEIFRGQLDQELSQQMTAASADQIARPMFERQFPRQADAIREYEASQRNSHRQLGRFDTAG